jgi:hypothetical protein
MQLKRFTPDCIQAAITGLDPGAETIFFELVPREYQIGPYWSIALQREK